MRTPCMAEDGVVESAAIVLPFPRVRHRGFIAKHAGRMVGLPSTTAEKYLARQLAVQRETMVRRGIAIASIDQELSALEGAIRAAMWRLGRSIPDGAAG